MGRCVGLIVNSELIIVNELWWDRKSVKNFCLTIALLLIYIKSRIDNSNFMLNISGVFVMKFVLSEYIVRAMMLAEYDKLEDNSYAGRIPACKGVIAFGSTLRECEEELRSVLEDWILVGLKLKYSLPVIEGIDLY